MKFNAQSVDEYGEKLIERVMNYAEQKAARAGEEACGVLIARNIVIPPAAMRAIKDANRGALFVLADTVALLPDEHEEG